VDPVFAALGEPVRRRILEVLSAGERSAGAVVAVLRERSPISQPAASQHLKVLREAGLITFAADGNRRLYRLDPDGIEAARGWLGALLDPGALFTQPLDALETEVARGKRDRRASAARSAQGAAATRAG
jgi:DNA-binding transcriptional ArsR family regulator